MSDMSSRVHAFLKKRDERNALPKVLLGIWVGSFLMALGSDTLYSQSGGLGIGGKGNLIFIVVLAVFYWWRHKVITRQLADLQQSLTAEDRDALLREIVG